MVPYAKRQYDRIISKSKWNKVFEEIFVTRWGKYDEGGKNERTMTFRYVPSKQQVQNMSGNFAYETTAKENFKVRISEVQADNRPNGEGELEKYVYDVKTGRAAKA